MSVLILFNKTHVYQAYLNGGHEEEGLTFSVLLFGLQMV